MSRILGLDLGQAQDYTALAIVEAQGTARMVDRPGPWRYSRMLGQEARTTVTERVEGPPVTLQVRALERFELGTPYPRIVARVVELVKGSGAALAIDATGVGAPVVDMFHMAGLRPHAVYITAGEQTVWDSDTLVWHIPKKELVAVLQAGLQEGRLKIASELPEAATLAAELANFQARITGAGNETYGAWREGTHDDLVLAVAIACYIPEALLREAAAA